MGFLEAIANIVFLVFLGGMIWGAFKYGGRIK